LAKVILTRPWAELDCRLDVIGVTRGCRVEMDESIYELTDLRNMLNSRVNRLNNSSFGYRVRNFEMGTRFPRTHVVICTLRARPPK